MMEYVSGDMTIQFFVNALCRCILTIFPLFAGCSYGQGEYSIYTDGTLINTGGQYAASESTSFGSCSTTPTPTLSPTSAPTVACDAGTSLFQLDLFTDRFGGEISWALFDDCSNSIVQSGPTKILLNTMNHTALAVIHSTPLSFMMRHWMESVS